MYGARAPDGVGLQLATHTGAWATARRLQGVNATAVEHGGVSRRGPPARRCLGHRPAPQGRARRQRSTHESERGMMDKGIQCCWSSRSSGQRVGKEDDEEGCVEGVCIDGVAPCPAPP
jgi:hypothetical protein